MSRTVRGKDFWALFLRVQELILADWEGESNELVCMHAYPISIALYENKVGLDEIGKLDHERLKEILQTQPEYSGIPPGFETWVAKTLNKPSNSEPPTASPETITT